MTEDSDALFENLTGERGAQTRWDKFLGESCKPKQFPGKSHATWYTQARSRQTKKNVRKFLKINGFTYWYLKIYKIRVYIIDISWRRYIKMRGYITRSIFDIELFKRKWTLMGHIVGDCAEDSPKVNKIGSNMALFGWNPKKERLVLVTRNTTPSLC